MDATASRLAFVPVSMFSMVMGMVGLALVWQKAHVVWGLSPLVGASLRGVASTAQSGGGNPDHAHGHGRGPWRNFPARLGLRSAHGAA